MADDAPRPAYHAALGAPEMDLRALLGKRKKNDGGEDEEELFSRPQTKRAAVSAQPTASAAGERAPFGYPRCNSGTDEQAICALYQDGHTAWTWIHPRHNYIPWLPRWIVDVDAPPTVFHFFNTKPWQMARDEWPDLEAWWRMAAAVVRRYPEVAGHFDAASVAIPAVLPRCCWCADKGKELDRLRAARHGDAPPVRDIAHVIFDDDGRLACPALQPTAADNGSHIAAAALSLNPAPPASALAATALRWSEADEDDRASP
jgi:hypothetical protein